MQQNYNRYLIKYYLAETALQIIFSVIPNDYKHLYFVKFVGYFSYNKVWKNGLSYLSCYLIIPSKLNKQDGKPAINSPWPFSQVANKRKNFHLTKLLMKQCYMYLYLHQKTFRQARQIYTHTWHPNLFCRCIHLLVRRQQTK